MNVVKTRPSNKHSGFSTTKWRLRLRNNGSILRIAAKKIPPRPRLFVRTPAVPVLLLPVLTIKFSISKSDLSPFS